MTFINSQAGFILKLTILSLVLSIGIKLLGQWVLITPTPSKALILVLTLPGIMTIILWWRMKQYQPLSNKE